MQTDTTITRRHSGHRNIEIKEGVENSVVIAGDNNIVVYVAGYRRLDNEAAPVSPESIGANPYRSLDAFDEKDADLFFGREEQVERLWRRLRDLHQGGRGRPLVRFMAVLGPSGCGKSSLVRAGLIPELARKPAHGWKPPRVAVLTPGEHPIAALKDVLTTIMSSRERPGTLDDSLDRLGERRPGGFYSGLRQAAELIPDIAESPVLVFVDQFEEVYTLCKDGEESAAFIGTLLDAASDPSRAVSVVIAMRVDFLSETQRHPAFNQAVTEGFLVPVMEPDELRRAIAQPAIRAGHPLEPELVEALVKETEGRAGALPLLQFALTQIWHGLANGVKGADTLRSLGGVGGALAAKAQQLFNELPTESDKAIARRAFLSAVQLGEGTQDTRRPARLSDIVARGEDPQRVLALLRRFSSKEQRLLSLSSAQGATAQGGITVEITHEALLEHWGLLRRWLEEDRDDLRFQRRLAEATKYWSGKARARGLLWRPPDLSLLRSFHARRGRDMTEEQTVFYTACLRQHQASLALRWGAVAAAIAVLAVFYVVKAQHNHRLLADQSRFLAFLARQETEAGDGMTGVLLALEALPKTLEAPDRPYVREAELALYTAVYENRELRILNAEGPAPAQRVTSVAFSSDGKHILAAFGDGKARLWDAETGAQFPALSGHAQPLLFAAFKPDDNSIVLTTSQDNTARIWNTVTGASRVLGGHGGQITHAAFSRDGQRIVTTSTDKTARLWDIANDSPPQIFVHQGDTVGYAAVSDDLTRVVTTSDDGAATLWDAGTGKQVRRFSVEGERIVGATFTPDGARVITVAENATVRHWSAGNEHNNPLQTFDGGGAVVHAAFSPDRARLAVALHDQTIRIWNTETGKDVGPPLREHEGHVQFIAFSRDNAFIATAAASQSIGTASVPRPVRIWEVATGRLVATLRGHSKPVGAVAFSPSGLRLATGSDDQTVRLWDARDEKSVATLAGYRKARGHEDDAGARVAMGLENRPLAFSPDGRRLAAAADDGGARVWNIDDRSEVRVLEGANARVSVLTFRPGSAFQVAAGSTEGDVGIWSGDRPSGIMLEKHRGAISALGYSDDGRMVLTASWDGTARVWRSDTWTSVTTLEGHAGAVLSAAFSPDGRHVLTAGDDGTARLWRAIDGAPLGIIGTHDNRIVVVGFSPDGRRALTGSWDGKARLWDARATGDAKLVALVEMAHYGFVRSAGFSPDGKLIVTACDDGAAYLWRSDDGERLGVLRRANGARILFATFMPAEQDRRRGTPFVVTTAEDGLVEIWDAATASRIAALDGHRKEATAAVADPKGQHIATASADQTVRLWRVLPTGQALIEKARALRTRELSAEDRQRFFLSPAAAVPRTQSYAAKEK